MKKYIHFLFFFYNRVLLLFGICYLHLKHSTFLDKFSINIFSLERSDIVFSTLKLQQFKFQYFVKEEISWIKTAEKFKNNQCQKLLIITVMSQFLVYYGSNSKYIIAGSSSYQFLFILTLNLTFFVVWWSKIKISRYKSRNTSTSSVHFHFIEPEPICGFTKRHVSSHLHQQETCQDLTMV